MQSNLGKPENRRAIRGYAILAKGNKPRQIKEKRIQSPLSEAVNTLAMLDERDN